MSLIRVPSGNETKTGPIQFGADLPGIYIAGDAAMLYSLMLFEVQAASRDLHPDIRMQLEGLQRLLASCRDEGL